MDCPICTREVRNVTPPIYTGVVIECPRCGGLRIMASVLDDLRALGIDDRLVALRKAKAQSSKTAWPTISRACL
jgi:DNA-directed RNA polymerase subunit RPC12/RpoP